MYDHNLCLMCKKSMPSADKRRPCRYIESCYAMPQELVDTPVPLSHDLYYEDMQSDEEEDERRDLVCELCPIGCGCPHCSREIL